MNVDELIINNRFLFSNLRLSINAWLNWHIYLFRLAYFYHIAVNKEFPTPWSYLFVCLFYALDLLFDILTRIFCARTLVSPLQMFKLIIKGVHFSLLNVNAVSLLIINKPVHLVFLNEMNRTYNETKE